MPYWTTKIEVYKDGRNQVYHSNPSGNVTWTHPVEETCYKCPPGRAARGLRGVLSPPKTS